MAPEDQLNEIRERAHQIWLYRTENGIPGTPESDWYAAEAEMEVDRKIKSNADASS
jgi:hypothetical protein